MRPSVSLPWLAAGALALAVLLGSFALALSTAGAQDAKPEHEVAALHRALIRAVTLPGGHHVAHCRRASGGCSARMLALARLFVEHGAAYDVDPWLLAAIASRESGLHPWAVGGVGETGVLQLHPRGAGRRVARLLERPGARAACERRIDACQRPVIDAGARLLAAVLARCGDERAALGAYQSGQCGERPYSARVLRRRDELRAWAAESGGES